MTHRPSPPDPVAERLFAQAVGLDRAGQAKAALDAYLRVLAHDPGHARSLYQIGAVAHRSGDLAMARRFFARAAEAAPAMAAAHYSLGLTAQAQGEAEAAEASLRQALSLEPGLIQAHLALALLLQAQGRPDEAAVVLEAALAADPASAEAWMNLGNLRREQRRLAEAERCGRRAAELAPASPLAWRNLAVTLRELARLDEALAAYDRALDLAPDFAAAQSERLFLLNYRPGLAAQAVADAHRHWGQALEARISPAPGPWPERGPRIRLGYVSGDLRVHPVGWLLAPVLEAHDRAAFEIHLFDTSGGAGDDLTHRLRAAADGWHDLAALDDAAAQRAIRAAGIDILVDLSGHTARNRLALFARRCAPVQAAWLGYPATTGLAAAFDAAIFDDATVPAGAEALFAEPLIRLPRGRFCYVPPAYAPAPAAPPSAAGAPVTFGSFNELTKLNPEVIALWAQVLAQVSGSRLKLKWTSLDEPQVRARLTEAFAAQGVGPERLILSGYAPHARMLAEYAQVDIALDPFPFGGGMTSLEALAMGVPVITWPGAAPASRQTLAFLTELGLTELAAGSAADYVARAAALAGDPQRLAELRQGLRPHLAASALGGPARFTPTLEAAWRGLLDRAATPAEPASQY